MGRDGRSDCVVVNPSRASKLATRNAIQLAHTGIAALVCPLLSPLVYDERAYPVWPDGVPPVTAALAATQIFSVSRSCLDLATTDKVVAQGRVKSPPSIPWPRPKSKDRIFAAVIGLSILVARYPQQRRSGAKARLVHSPSERRGFLQCLLLFASDVRVRIGDGGDHDNTSRNAMKNDAVKNNRRIFKERIKAG